MTKHAKKNASYEDLQKYPEGTRAEIIDGVVEVTPRPNHSHRAVELNLGSLLNTNFGRKSGGNSWIIELEPEVKFNSDILIPDIAGWRIERRPDPNPMESLVSILPNWTCEIVSPSSGRMDRIVKYNIYLKTGVDYYWIIDPVTKTLEAFVNEAPKWNRIGAWAENDKARIAPFEELELDLSSLWIN
jgi:Uma2 family endonuclease